MTELFGVVDLVRLAMELVRLAMELVRLAMELVRYKLAILLLFCYVLFLGNTSVVLENNLWR